MRLIDADWLKNKATPRDRNGITEFITTVLFGLIDRAPTIDAEPVRHGKWIGKPIAGYCTVRCSVCGDVLLMNDGKYRYCPNCGARMDAE